MKYFVMMIFSAAAHKKVEYPLIEFIRNMYVKEEE